MSRKIDLTGQVFGSLTVIREAAYPPGGEARWVCFCSACGKPEHIVRGSLLRSGHTKSCGCLIGQAEDLTGQRFGRLEVLRRSEAPLTRELTEQTTRSAWWWCHCDCGNEKAISAQALKTGGAKSCGCLQKQRAVETHTGHATYESDPAKRSESATRAHSVLRKYGSNAPRPRAKFLETLHNKEWLTEQYVTQWKSKAEVGRMAGCAARTVQQALDRLGIKRVELSPDLVGKGFTDGRGRPRVTGDAVTSQVMYGRARRLVAPGPCVVCREVGKHINHKDRNPWNNNPANLERLCVKCHNGQHSVEEAVMIEWLRDRFGVSFMEVHLEARRRLQNAS